MAEGFVIVGTCGWSVRGGKEAYFKTFKLIELQETFYKLPKVSTVEKWRKIAPEDFEFTVKAWQVMTHPPTSPTWRKAKLKISPELKDKYGNLKPTEENFKAWENVLEICKALRATVCIFQTPPSFKYSSENESNVIQFFSSIKRNSLRLGWEPRGTWHDHMDRVKELCKSLDLIHVVDVLKRRPTYVGDVCYFRLHGLGRGEVNYRYKYTDEDLAKLASIVKGYVNQGCEVYVLFNNVYMRDDALRFKEVAKSHGIRVL
mgnify:CR=1 FL=1